MLLRHGRCARFARPAGDATSPWPDATLRQGRPRPCARPRARPRPCPPLLQLPLPLPLLSLFISHSIAPLNLKLPRPLSRPFPCPPRSVEQLMLDLVLKNVKQTQRNNKQSKTHRFAPRFYLPSPNLGPLPAVLCCDIAKEPKMLDRFRRGTSKQQSKFTFASSPLRC